MKTDLKADLLMTPDEVCTLFRHEGDKRWAYRHAGPGGFLRPAARRFGRTLLFLRSEVEAMIEKNGLDGGVVGLYDSTSRRDRT